MKEYLTQMKEHVIKCVVNLLLWCYMLLIYLSYVLKNVSCNSQRKEYDLDEPVSVSIMEEFDDL